MHSASDILALTRVMQVWRRGMLRVNMRGKTLSKGEGIEKED